MNKRAEGSRHEDEAAAWLEKQGYTVLEKNFRWARGEIDLIAHKDSTLIFIEVKYRSSSRYGFPEEAVPHQKQIKIIRTAQYYLNLHGYKSPISCRFDVIAIEGEHIRHIENAFEQEA